MSMSFLCGFIIPSDYLFCDRTNTKTVVAVEEERTVFAFIEVEVAPAVLEELIERRRPVVAIGAGAAENSVVAKAGSGEEDGLPTWPNYNISIIHPFPSTLGVKFFKFVYRRHAPRAPPLHMGHIIGEFELCQVVQAAITTFRAIFGQG